MDPTVSDDVNAEFVEAACEVMHDAYEKAAVGAGWETNAQSRQPWALVPEANKVAMRAAVRALADWLPSTESWERLDEIRRDRIYELTGIIKALRGTP